MPSIVTTSCLLLVLGWVIVDGQFVNDFDQEAIFECPPNQILSFIFSIHSNFHEDRQWQFLCRPVLGRTSGCHWTDYLNAFDELLDYSCPENEVLNGMSSYHDNGPEDRRFMVQCCNVSGTSTSSCYTTGFLNNLDEVLNFTVPDGSAIKGVYSVHDNDTQDRRFQFTLCVLASQNVIGVVKPAYIGVVKPAYIGVAKPVLINLLGLVKVILG